MNKQTQKTALLKRMVEIKLELKTNSSSSGAVTSNVKEAGVEVTGPFEREVVFATLVKGFIK